MAPWVVDPLVARFGLIYDISDFTETVSLLRRSGALEQDRSFRMMFRFQRRVNRLASQHKAKLEKYLGDGAFYSSREAHHLLVLAMQIQRAYREALAKGFPFSNGLRIALNHGQYRLLPIQIGGKEEGGDRYEFFGHGVVELTRLTSGKASREIDEIKTLLITLGYPEPVVNRFFAPMTRQNLDVVNKVEESRSFYSYINPNGSLVNEGIVATLDFIQRLEKESVAAGSSACSTASARTSRSRSTPPNGSLLVGVRKLGVAQLKGLDRLPVYEIVDASLWGDNTLVELRGGLLETDRARVQLGPEQLKTDAHQQQGERRPVSTGTTSSVWQTDLPGLPAPRRGKVRDIYDLGDRLLLVATDRLSAYDHVLRPAIPGKGKILTQLTNFWLERLSGIVPNHLLATEVADFPAELQPPAAELAAARSLVRKAAGAALRVRGARLSRRQRLQGVPRRGTACGIPLPPGSQRASRLPSRSSPRPPRRSRATTRTSPSRLSKPASGAPPPSRLRDLTLALYRAGAEHAESVGLLLADTKFEFGTIDGEIVLIDEALTPDSSRYWEADAWQPGRRAGLVRQAVRPQLARRLRLGPRIDAARAAAGGRRRARATATSRLFAA